MRVFGVALLLALAVAPMASAMTWQEANKASVALMNEGKLKDAFDMAWQATELYEQTPTYKAASHQRLLLNALDIFLQREDLRGTPPTVRRAIAALERHVPEGDVTTIALYEQLAIALSRIGEFEQAQAARDRVISLYARNHGEDSLGHLGALLDQARAVKRVQDIVVTRSYLDRASALTEKLAPDHVLRLNVDYEQALLTLEAGRKDEAVPLFEDIVRRAAGTQIAESQSILRKTYGMLAYIAYRRGDHETEDRMVEATRGLPVPEGEIRPLFREAPDMPGAPRLSLSGIAKVEFKVSTVDGKVKETKVLEKSGNPQFAALAMDAISKWRYQPTAAAGAPGELITLQQSFQYQYENERPELGTRLKRNN